MFIVVALVTVKLYCVQTIGRPQNHTLALKWASAVNKMAATNHLSGRGLVQRQGGVPEGAVHQPGN